MSPNVLSLHSFPCSISVGKNHSLANEASFILFHKSISPLITTNSYKSPI